MKAKLMKKPVGHNSVAPLRKLKFLRSKHSKMAKSLKKLQHLIEGQEHLESLNIPPNFIAHVFSNSSPRTGR